MVQCHISLLPMNSQWQQDYAQREPLLTDTPELCCTNGPDRVETLGLALSGRQGLP